MIDQARRRRGNREIAGLFLILGSFACLGALVTFGVEVRFVARAKHAYANVVRVDRRTWSDWEGSKGAVHVVQRVNEQAILSFTAENGQVVALDVPGGAGAGVLYLPDDPERAQTDDLLTMWGLPSLLLLLGLALLAGWQRLRTPGAWA